LWADDLARSAFAPKPLGDVTDSLPLEVDEHDKETGRIDGIEMSLLSFDRWGDLPKLDVLWQLPGQEPLPTDKLLKRVQKELRERKAWDAA